MTTITREQAKDLRNAFECWQQDYDAVADKEQYDMFGLGMAAMDMLIASMYQEPVAWDYEWASYITCEGPQDFKRVIEREAPPEWAIDEGQARDIIPLYRHPQPAPELYAMPGGLVYSSYPEVYGRKIFCRVGHVADPGQ